MLYWPLRDRGTGSRRDQNDFKKKKARVPGTGTKRLQTNRGQEAQMYKSILVPIDLADTDLAKPAIATAATLSQTWNGTVRLLNVLPMTPVMLAEYVPADFDSQQRETSEEALAIVARESGIAPSRISGVVRQGGIYHEILEEAATMKADLIVMTSHRPAMRTYFLGSNAGHVVRYAKCSVLVVRH
ncbi:nucleotide-binding universal stress UspA family protein [Bradyrhizobium sp. USDA 3256]